MRRTKRMTLMFRNKSKGSPIGENKIYGVSWDKSSSPTLTRTDDSVGFTAEAGVGAEIVTNDFDATEIYKDITTAVDALGNTFVKIPKFYIKKTNAVGSYTIQISRYQHSGYYLPYCFWDFDNSAELDYFYVGAYTTSLDGSSRLESKSGNYPLVNTNIVNMRTYAENNGAGYHQFDIHAHDLLSCLFMVEFATLNSQSIMFGFANGRYSASDLATATENGVNRIIVANAIADYYRVGQPIGIGTSRGGNQIFYGRDITVIDVYDASNKAISFDGAAVNIATGNYLYNVGWKSGFSSGISATSGSLVSNSDGKYPFVYRGVENLWGNVWQFIDGININDHQSWVALNHVDYASNVFASPYLQLDYANHNASGYITEMGFDSNYPFAQYPISVGGGAATYYSDYYYQATGQRIAVAGGRWYYGARGGLSYWSLIYASSGAYINVGGRLLKSSL